MSTCISGNYSMIDFAADFGLEIVFISSVLLLKKMAINHFDIRLLVA